MARDECLGCDVEGEKLHVDGVNHCGDEGLDDGGGGVQVVYVGGGEVEEGFEVGDSLGERGEGGGGDVLHL